MNSSELTIHLPLDDAEFAKDYAQSQGISIDELIDRYLKRLRVMTTNGLHPEIEKFSGVVPADVNAEGLYTQHLLKKHQ